MPDFTATLTPAPALPDLSHVPTATVSSEPLLASFTYRTALHTLPDLTDTELRALNAAVCDEIKSRRELASRRALRALRVGHPARVKVDAPMKNRALRGAACNVVKLARTRVHVTGLPGYAPHAIITLPASCVEAI